MGVKCIFCSLLLASTTLYAQDTNELKPFTISGNRMETPLMESGRNVQLITSEMIEAMPVQNLNELLQHISGVDFRQRGAWGAQADVSLRGGTFDQTLILVNGIKVSDPQTGHHNMNLGIDLNAIKQIEVIKGPAAARYGLNAFSGVINIIIAPEEDDQLRMGFGAAQAHNSKLPEPFYGGYQSHASAHFGVGKSRQMLSFSRDQSTGYRQNTDLNRHSVNYLGELKGRFGKFAALGSLVDNAFGAAGFYAFPIDSTSEEQVRTYMAALQHTISRGAFRLHTKIYSRKNFDTYTLFREQPEVFQNRHRTDVEGIELHGAFTYDIGTLGMGLEYRREAINSTNLGLRVRDNYGVFLENRLWLMKDRLTVNTSLYINESSDFDMQFLPSLELSYSLTERLSFFGNAGQSFRVPTFTDLYYQGPTNIGNPNLTPERSINYEIGSKWMVRNQFVQASAFYQNATNLIDWVRDSLTQPWQPRNYDAVATIGAEFNYELRLKMPIAMTPFSIGFMRIGYTWLDMRIADKKESISRYALNNLRHQANTQLSLSWNDRFFIIPTIRFVDRKNYKQYWLADMRLKYKIKDVALWFDCTNLFDTDFIEAANAPMPGRWYRAGVDLRLRS